MAVYKFDKNEQESLIISANNRNDAIEIAVSSGRNWVLYSECNQIYARLPGVHKE